MKSRSILIFLPILLMIFFSTSCVTTFHVTLPEGFALVEEGKRFLAVSPEGLKYRVKTEPNYPEKDVAFWSAVLIRQLEDEGYKSRSDGEYFECPAGRGFFLEWNLPYGGETFTYMTAIVPHGETIYVAESAAEHSIYRVYREVILESLKSISAD